LGNFDEEEITNIMADVIYCNAALGTGLCNRLKTLVSCMRMCVYHKKKIVLYWPPDRNMFNCHFEDLFENNFEQTDTMLGLCEASATRFWLLPNDVPKRFATVHPNYSDAVTLGFYTKHPEDPSQVIDYEYDRIPIALRQEYLRFFNELIPVKCIKKIVERYIREIPDNTVGVHIRRTDLMRKPGRNMGTDDKFMKTMDECIEKEKDVKFFLATDCPIAEENFKQRYGSSILAYQKRSFDRRENNGIQDALIDLLLLSKAKHIIGSHLSSFTELAWWFGQCKAKVDIIR